MKYDYYMGKYSSTLYRVKIGTEVIEVWRKNSKYWANLTDILPDRYKAGPRVLKKLKKVTPGEAFTIML